MCIVVGGWEGFVLNLIVVKWYYRFIKLIWSGGFWCCMVMENGRSEIMLGERRIRYSYVFVEIFYEVFRKGMNFN